jgi:hypothetical protein
MTPAVEDGIGFALIAFLQALTIWFKNRSDQRQTAQLSGMAKVGVDTHTLVNNAMSIQLTLYAKKARDLANLTGSRPDIEDANLAESKLRDHLAKQAIVDDGGLR